MTTCIGCGCDDEHACQDPETGELCAWASIDTQGVTGKPKQFGICTQCAEADDAEMFPWASPLILPGDPDFTL